MSCFFAAGAGGVMQRLMHAATAMRHGMRAVDSMGASARWDDGRRTHTTAYL
jgi:hypothetical protein